MYASLSYFLILQLMKNM